MQRHIADAGSEGLTQMDNELNFSDSDAGKD